MGRTGHRLTGVAAGCLAASALWRTESSLSLVSILAGYFGGTAPDWLEIAHAEYSQKYHRWMRRSVIPHRTVTHWWLIWAIATAALVTWAFPAGNAWSLFRVAAFGFLAGAWMHLLMDLPNPTGIPMLSPFAKSRFGLGWWKSGNALEPIAGVLMVIAAGLLLVNVAHFGFSIATLQNA